MKHIVGIGLVAILLSGCSAKNSAMQNGAILGGLAGATLGGIAGSEIGGTHNGPSSKAEGAIVLGLVIGLIGLGIGAGTGYIIDEVTQDDKEMDEMLSSNQQMEELNK